MEPPQRPAPYAEGRTANLSALFASYPIPGITVLPLRLFLGVTFIYAGIQKLSDPGFLRPGAPTYIGAQLLGFSRGSPIRFFLLHLMEHAAPLGMLTIVTELVVGTLILIGLFTRPAALVGLSLNLVFFLSASWHTYPYFMGADIVWVACWLTLALTGPGAFALDAVVQPALYEDLRDRWGRGLAALAVPLVSGPAHTIAAGEQVAAAEEEPARPGPLAATARVLTRAEVLLGLAATAVLVLLGLAPRGGVSAGATGKLAGGPPSSTSGGSSAGPQPTAAPGGSSSSSAAPAGIPTGARKIGNVSQLPANAAGMVSDPKTGDPAIIIHTGGSSYYAYDAVCTHAGCTVQYDPQQKLIVCPCHGGAFDPAHGAQVVGGPPPAPLSPIEMKIDAKGNIYIV